MKYIVELPIDLAKKVQALISKGNYENLSQFTVTAFENQLMLEESPSEQLANVVETVNEEKLSIAKTGNLDSLLLINFSPEKTRVVASPTSDKIPNDCLWGQYNRIFPVKITLRVLANLLNDKETIELETLQSSAVRAAREVGLILKKEDKKRGNKYGEMLSSALPTRRNIAKAEKRFGSHFVGYYTRAGRIEGASGALKFLNIFEDIDGNCRVGITQAGLGFASLVNPVLDEKRFEATLGRAESSFYIEHVAQNLERETKIMFAVLRTIGDSESSPTDLNSKLSSFSRGWSSAMTNTIRAGVISRLHEMGLIQRRRDKVRVSYLLTEYGKETLGAYREKGVI